MKNVIKKTLAVLFAAGLTCAVGTTSVMAAGAEVVISGDTSGNIFGAGQDISISASGYDEVKNELYLAGMNLYADDIDVDGSAYIAGNTISVKNSDIGGSLYIAGSNISVDSDVNNNIWGAGSVITLGGNTKAKSVKIAGANINVSGEYEAAALCGDAITFNGKVNGDLTIEGDRVKIGDDAEVTGTLKVVSSEEPSIESGAEITEYTFEKVKDDDDSADNAGKIGKGVAKAAKGTVIIAKIGKVIKNLFRYAVLALVFALVFSRNLTDAYEYCKKKPGELWGFGALTLICAPIAAIVLCITVIGLPVAGLSMAVYALVLAFSRVFAFASLVRELIFTHTSKRLNPFLETVLAVLPAAIIKAIPFIGGLVGFACAIYTMGYVTLAAAKMIAERNTKAQPEAVTAENAAEPEEAKEESSEENKSDVQ